MKKYYSLVLIFFLASFTNAFAEWSIFLLIGQSNMAGGPSDFLIDSISEIILIY